MFHVITSDKGHYVSGRGRDVIKALDNLGHFRHHHPRLSRRWPMPKQDAKLLPGTLDMLILKALSLGALHGFGVGQRIMQMSADALRVEEGSLYPALYRIEQQGWIESEWGVSENNQRAKFYRLTRAGRKQLQVEEENWQRLAAAVFKVMQTS